MSNRPYKFEINDILRRATKINKGNRDPALLSHVNREVVGRFNDDREKVGYLTKHFFEFEVNLTQQLELVNSYNSGQFDDLKEVLQQNDGI